MSPAQMQAYQDAIVNAAKQNINRSAGTEAQRVSEAAFGRGMGLSTLNAYQQALIQGEQARAVAQAESQAQQATRQAQLAALGQAASYMTSQRQLGQQQSQFDRSLKANKEAQMRGMIGSGLAGLAGAALKGGGYVFGDDIKKGLRGAMGLGGEEKPNSSIYGGATAASGQGPGNVHANEPIEANLAAIAQPQTESMPDSYDFGGSSPSGGGSYGDFTAYDPSQFDMGGSWGNLADLLDENNWSF